MLFFHCNVSGSHYWVCRKRIAQIATKLAKKQRKNRCADFQTFFDFFLVEMKILISPSMFNLLTAIVLQTSYWQISLSVDMKLKVSKGSNVRNVKCDFRSSNWSLYIIMWTYFSLSRFSQQLILMKLTRYMNNDIKPTDWDWGMILVHLVKNIHHWI